MKNFLCFSLALMMGLNVGISWKIEKTKAADATNLINNSSAENLDSNGMPVGWQKDQWGGVTSTLSVADSGQNGAKSLLVSVTSASGGDAKWYFTPVNVKAGSTYTFSDYYKSSVSTSIDVQVTDSTGADKYIWLGDPAASSDWKLATYKFTAPGNATKVTIFHSIGSIGALQTDSFSLTEDGATPPPPPPPPPPVGLIPNSSLEQNNGGTNPVPTDWKKNTYSSNSATFSYLNEGHSGNHSAKVEITKYTNGDSKWYFTPQKIAGGNYIFSDYYKSNIGSEVDAEIKLSDGTVKYPVLGSAMPSSDWTQFTCQLVIPANATSVTIFHLIAGVGYLVTDDFSLSSGSLPGFSRPIVTLTFDDGLKSQSTNALPIMQKYGDTGTFYIVSSYNTFSNYMNLNDLKGLKNAGNEIGSHTVDHKDLTTLTSAQVNNELANSKQYLEQNLGVTVTDFASPYGAFNASTIGQIKTYYQSHRSTQGGYNAKSNFDPYNIRVQNIRRNTTVDQVNAWLSDAVANNYWLVLTFHGVDNGTDIYGTSPTNFDSFLKAIKNKNITVKNMNAALAEAMS